MAGYRLSCGMHYGASLLMECGCAAGRCWFGEYYVECGMYHCFELYSADMWQALYENVQVKHDFELGGGEAQEGEKGGEEKGAAENVGVETVEIVGSSVHLVEVAD